METNKSLLFSEINSFCDELVGEFNLISEERKEQLTTLSHYISHKIEAKEIPKLIVICTHNSRRSHLGQIWLSVGADYYGLPEINTYSGGTEATAFNIRAVKALQRIGFTISTSDEKTDNPIHQVTWRKDMLPYPAFSKKYNSDPNPQNKFAAIMVCTEADKGCPIVSGCDFRLPLPFEDPKAYDETSLEEAKYSERAKQIGREMLFVISQVSA
jgi:hypothetical protein